MPSSAKKKTKISLAAKECASPTKATTLRIATRGPYRVDAPKVICLKAALSPKDRKSNEPEIAHRPVMKLKLNLAAIPANCPNSIQVSSATSTSAVPSSSSPAKPPPDYPSKAQQEIRPADTKDEEKVTVMAKRRVGRPSKAEMLARMFASPEVIKNGSNMDGQFMANEGTPSRRSSGSRKDKRPKRKYTRRTPEERAAIKAKKEAAALKRTTTGAVGRDRRGRPTKEESLARARERQLREAAQTATVQTTAANAAMHHAVQTAWDAELKALKDPANACYGAAPTDQLLPYILLFHEDAPLDVGARYSSIESAINAQLGHFYALCARQDARLGQPELSVLDQRLCLEEERFLLAKLQKQHQQLVLRSGIDDSGHVINANSHPPYISPAPTATVLYK